MHQKLRSIVIIAVGMLVIGQLYGAARIANFEQDDPTWKLSLGAEFKGAKGRMERSKLASNSGDWSLKMDADFSAGGVYIEAQYKLPNPMPVAGMSLAVKAENVAKLVLRTIDATGQCHQHQLKLQQTNNWQIVSLKQLNSRLHWGGKNDGIWHHPLKRIGIILEKHQLIDKQAPGTLFIDDIDAPTEDSLANRKTGHYRLPLGTFEHTRDGWWLTFGPKARSSLRRDTSDSKSGAGALKWTTTGGSAYAHKLFDQPVDINSLSFWVKTSDLKKMKVTTINAVGQNYSKEIPLKADGAWNLIKLDSIPPGNGVPSKPRILYGGQTSVHLEVNARNSTKPDCTVYLDHIRATASGLGVVRLPGTCALANEDLCIKLGLERTLPFFWGRRDCPKSVNIEVTNYSSMPQPIPRIELLDYRLRPLTNLSVGSQRIPPGKTIDVKVPITLPKFGHYTIQAKLGNQYLRTSVAWLAAKGKPDARGPFGVQGHFNQGPWGKSQNLDDADGSLQLMRDLGAGWVRDDVRVSVDSKGNIRPDDETSESPFSYRAKAAKYGLQLLMAYADRRIDHGKAPHTEFGRKTYAKAYRTAIRRNMPEVKYFEVWNEPNIAPGWSGPPNAADYTRMLKSAYIAAKKLTPDVQVCGVVSCGTDFGFVREVCKNGGAKYMDKLSVHPYHAVAPERAENVKGKDLMLGASTGLTFANRIRRLRSILDEFGAKKVNILGTEMGYPNKDIKVEYQQTCWLVRQYLIGMSMPYLERQFNYNFQDQGYEENENSHMTFGLVRTEGIPKARFVAYNTMTRMLFNKKFHAKVDLGAGIYCYHFEDRDGGPSCCVIWSVDQGKTVAFRIPQPNISSTDLMGNTRTLAAQDGTYTIGVTGEPVFLTDLEGELSKAESKLSISGPDKITSEDVLKLSLSGSTSGQGEWQIEAPVGWKLIRNTPERVELQATTGTKGGSQSIVIRGDKASAATTIKLENTFFVTATPDPNAPSTIRVVVKNPFASRRKVILSPRSELVDLKPTTLVIPPRSKATTLVNPETKTAKGFISIPVKLNFSLPKGDSGRIQLEPGSSDYVVVATTPCPRKSGIQVDGKLNEWQSGEPCLINTKHQICALSPGGAPDWGGPDDLSARFWTAHDPQNFYLAMEVTDNRHVQNASPENLWQEDSVQLAFSVRGKRYQFELGIGATGKTTVHQSSPTKRRLSDILLKGSQNGGKTYYEVQIPWKILGVENLRKDHVTFAAVINDSDGGRKHSVQGSRKCYAEWCKGVGANKDTNLYTPLQLIGN